MFTSNHPTVKLNWIKFMDWYKLFEDQINKGLGAIIGIAITALLIFLRKLPKYITEKISESRNILAISTGGKISDEFDIIQENSLAMYNHIIYYENGGGAISKDKTMHMTIKWERVGPICGGCMSTICPLKINIPKLKKDWQDIEVSEGWRKVISRTVTAKGIFIENSIDDDEKLLTDEVKDIWKKNHIFVYREVVIKHKRKGFYSLGLSYCSKFKDFDIPKGILYKSINKLKELL